MPDETMKVTIFVSRDMHVLMKELAKRKRITLGNAYDQALVMFLKHPSNYMSSKRDRQLRKVQ